MNNKELSICLQRIHLATDLFYSGAVEDASRIASEIWSTLQDYTFGTVDENLSSAYQSLGNLYGKINNPKGQYDCLINADKALTNQAG